MLFQPALYMEYMKSVDFSTIECNLAMSGIDCPYTLAELGVTARVLEKGDFHAYGNKRLKEVIAAQYGVKTEQVLAPGGGSSLCNFLFAAALLSPGDRALVELPTYEPLRSTLASTGAEVVPLPRPADRSFDVDMTEFERLVCPPVKLVVLSRLHNPSCRDIPLEALIRMGEKAAKIGAYILVDEVYLDFLPEEKRKPAASLHPHLLSTASLTKVYGLGDLRTGWGIGPEELVWRCWRINNVLGVHPPGIPDNISLELFVNGGLERIGAWARRRAAENVILVEQFVQDHPQLEWVEPAGGIIAFIQLLHGGHADKLVQLLHDKYQTVVVPGSQFDQSDGFRLGFGCPLDDLKEGLRRIDMVLSELTI